jgi:multiple antibiotic resistance protein
MTEYITTLFVSFLVIIDPVGMLPIFVSLTYRQRPEERTRTAFRACGVAAATLFVVALGGMKLLEVMGVSMAAFRIAGGLLLLLVSIDMVFVRHSGIRSTTEEEEREASGAMDVAVFPLAIPLIAGPGAMASVVLLIGKAHGSLVQGSIVVSMMLVVVGLTLAGFLFAAPVLHRLGVTGINVVTRVFGIVLAALAIQYMIDGLREVLPTL